MKDAGVVITKRHDVIEMTEAASSSRAAKMAQEPTAQAAKRAKLLLLSSAKGGSTKTTTARNLAVAAAHAGLRVATIDLDLQATLTNWWQKRPDEAPAILHYQVPIQESEAALDEAVAANNLDIIIVDTPPGVENHPVAMRSLIRRVDFVLMPTTQGGPDLDSVIEWSRTVKREGRPSAFLLSRTKRAAKSFSAYLYPHRGKALRYYRTTSCRSAAERRKWQIFQMPVAKAGVCCTCVPRGFPQLRRTDG